MPLLILGCEGDSAEGNLVLSQPALGERCLKDVGCGPYGVN